MAIPHPIPYQGSKRNLAQTIIDYFPDDIDRLIEPFAGSAALSLAAAYAGKADRFVLNDLNASLMDLWWHIIHKPAELAALYEKLWHSQTGRERTFYDSVRLRFNRNQRPYYFLYLLARCVKASVRYNGDGEFNQSPDNRRKGRHPQTMRQDILGASRLLLGCTTLSAADYRKSLQIAAETDLVYLDPPYQGVCANRDPRYIQGITYSGFVQTLEDLNDRKISYIVSYDGRTGSKKFGQALPDSLELQHIELDAGRSSQATLLGRSDRTYEALYLSPALIRHLDNPTAAKPHLEQLSLFDTLT
jgi:DNA adenine methylase